MDYNYLFVNSCFILHNVVIYVNELKASHMIPRIAEKYSYK